MHVPAAPDPLDVGPGIGGGERISFAEPQGEHGRNFHLRHLAMSLFINRHKLLRLEVAPGGDILLGFADAFVKGFLDRALWPAPEPHFLKLEEEPKNSLEAPAG